MGKRTYSLFDYVGKAFKKYVPRPPLVPTDAPPGSPEKIAELSARLECGEELWHPDDNNALPQNLVLWDEYIGLGGVPGVYKRELDELGDSDDVREDDNPEFPGT